MFTSKARAYLSEAPAAVKILVRRCLPFPGLEVV